MDDKHRWNVHWRNSGTTGKKVRQSVVVTNGMPSDLKNVIRNKIAYASGTPMRFIEIMGVERLSDEYGEFGGF